MLGKYKAIGGHLAIQKILWREKVFSGELGYEVSPKGVI
jgi:hypothetical protein